MTKKVTSLVWSVIDLESNKIEENEKIGKRWNAVCDESRMHGVEQGKRWRYLQSLTYCYLQVILNLHMLIYTSHVE